MELTWKEKLASLPHWTDKQKKIIITYLQYTCNYGTGDVLAGSVLQGADAELAECIAKLLQLVDPPTNHMPYTTAMLMLRCRSENKLIQEVLTELDMLSANGSGCGYESFTI